MKSHGNWRHWTKEWGTRIGMVIGAAVWLLAMAISWASAAEYDFNWLDPDKKIYVLQNRRYVKAERLLLTGMVGTGLSNAYRSSVSLDPRLAYYFSEHLGIEVFYTTIVNSENGAFQALQQATGSGTLPVVREITSQQGALLHYVPWYAKINMFNEILYFDWYFSAGAGTTRAKLFYSTGSLNAPVLEESQFALYLGTGHQYHLNDYLTVRLDFSGAFYQAPVFGTTGENAWFSNYHFGAGIGLRL